MYACMRGMLACAFGDAAFRARRRLDSSGLPSSLSSPPQPSSSSTALHSRMTSIDPPSRSGTPTLGPPSRSMSPSPSLASLAHRPQPPGSLHARIRSAHAAPMSAPITVDVLAPPSRSSTPVQKAPPSPLSPAPDAHHADGPHSQGGPSADIGIYPEAVYDEYLGEWIGAIRRHLIRSLRWESEWLAWHQVSVVCPSALLRLAAQPLSRAQKSWSQNQGRRS